jgi:hypothetical protein
VEHDDLSVRPIAGREELGLFSRMRYVFNEELADDLVAGRRRPEWIWVALRGNRLLARLSWWRREGDGPPFLLDIFDIDDRGGDRDRVDIGVRLLEAAMAEVVPAGTRPPEYIRVVPSDWRGSEEARGVVEDRMLALERVGARLFVERLRFQWLPGTPVPEPTGRLVFRPVRDTGEILDLMTRVLDGTLDAHSREDLTRMSASEAAVRHYEDELAVYRSPRDCRTGRPAHPGRHRPWQHAHGERLLAPRIRQLRAHDQHDLALIGALIMFIPGSQESPRRGAVTRAVAGRARRAVSSSCAARQAPAPSPDRSRSCRSGSSPRSARTA